MLYRICGSSVLTAAAPGVDPRPALDEAVGLGFTLVRIFCGALPWKGQEIGHVYANLPGVLAECGARGLNAYLSYHTEAGTGLRPRAPHRRRRGDRAQRIPRSSSAKSATSARTRPRTGA